MSWASVKLEDICDVRDGTHESPKYVETGFPLLTSKNFSSGVVDYQGANLISDFDFRIINKRSKVELGDIVMPMIGTIGSPVIIDFEPDFAIKNVALIKFNGSTIDRRYLLRVLDGPLFKSHVQKAGRGGTQKFLSLRDMRQFHLPLPPLEEQKRIAAILDQADDIRRKRQASIDRLNQLGQAIFHEMFGDLLLSEDGAANLGDVCDVRDGTHDSPKYVDCGYPLLTSKNFSGGSIDYSGSNQISQQDYALINKRSKVDKGDIVMPMIGTIGSPVIVDFEPDFAIKNVALIKFPDGRMNQEFVRQVLDGSLFKSHVAGKGRGGTQKFISLGDIRGFKIPFPSIERQNAFAESMKKLREERSRHMDWRSRIESLFASLQHRAFTGQL